MSPNTNYLIGRRQEYARAKHWRDCGHVVLRTAGSHGFADLITISPAGDVQFIQVKRCDKEAQALRLIKQFKESPPLGIRIRGSYYQRIEVYCKETKKVVSSWAQE